MQNYFWSGPRRFPIRQPGLCSCPSRSYFTSFTSINTPVPAILPSSPGLDHLYISRTISFPPFSPPFCDICLYTHTSQCHPTHGLMSIDNWPHNAEAGPSRWRDGHTKRKKRIPRTATALPVLSFLAPAFAAPYPTPTHRPFPRGETTIAVPTVREGGNTGVAYITSLTTPTSLPTQVQTVDEDVLPFVLTRADDGKWKKAENAWKLYGVVGAVCLCFGRPTLLMPDRTRRRRFVCRHVVSDRISITQRLGSTIKSNEYLPSAAYRHRICRRGAISCCHPYRVGLIWLEVDRALTPDSSYGGIKHNAKPNGERRGNGEKH